MENKELLPCPFCGECPVVRLIPSLSIAGERYYVKCLNDNCGVEVKSKPIKFKNKAIELWNKRV